MIASILAILSAIIGLAAWWIQRKKAPTIEERKEDVRQYFNDSFQEAYKLRQQGNHAEAEAMLRRLYNVSAGSLPNLQQPAKPGEDKTGQRMGDNDPEGQSDNHS